MLMKQVTAIIRSHKLNDVRDALMQLGIGGITVTEAMGYGRQHGHTETYRGAEYKVEFVQKIRIDVVAPENLVPDMLAAIQKSAQTGKVGDGKIFVAPVEEVMRIRTAERGLDAV
jgi:nitrogen regulatory protein PII